MRREWWPALACRAPRLPDTGCLLGQDGQGSAGHRHHEGHGTIHSSWVEDAGNGMAVWQTFVVVTLVVKL